MSNITESESAAALEFLRLLQKHGAKMGNNLNALIDQGLLDPHDKVRLAISAEDIQNMSPNFDNLPLPSSFFMKLGAPESSTMINGVITATGVMTAGYSAIRLRVATDPIAKGFYATSILFSTSAVATGSFAVMTRMCRVYEAAVFSEIFGGTFLWLGEQAHAAALKAEGKPVPPKYQGVRPRIPSYNNQNLSFIMPGNFNCAGLSDIIQQIPFETIGKVVGVVFTTYGYYKIVIMSYRYSQKLISKFKEQQQQNKLIKYRSLRLHRQAHFLAISICNCPSFRRTSLIYKTTFS